MELLKMELLAGSSDAPEGHPGYLTPGSDGIHPSHERIREILMSHGINVEIVPSYEHGVRYSDASVFFDEDQILTVLEAMKKSGCHGHVLEGPVDRFSDEVILLASQNVWALEPSSV